MDPETFILRKKFLEEFYKERVNFTFKKDIIKDEYKDYIDKLLTYETNVFYPETFNLGFVKRIIPFIFYLNSLYGCNLNDDIIINPFPNKPLFLRVCSTILLKTLWEKEKLLITSNFSFSHSVFYPFEELSAIFIKFKNVVCILFQFGRV